jgi:carboxyl-terminal processing protease
MPHRNLIAIALVGIASLLCWRSSQAEPRDEMLELYGLFVDAVEQVESNYVRPVSRRELLESALQGMLQNLDPHSDYFSQARWDQFKRTFEGDFTGIGIQVEIDPQSKRLKVLAPLIGTPAYKAGILAGDRIVEIEGKSTKGFRVEDAVKVLRGRAGEPVTLGIQRPGTDKIEQVSLVREVIQVSTVLGDRYQENGDWGTLASA